MKEKDDRSTQYDEGSLTLSGTVMLGTGVMIGAGIFALTGQMAEMTGALFPLAFLAAAIIVGFSAYSYIKMSNAYPSAGGIGMYLHKAYGDRLPTAFNALLMYFSMVLNRSRLHGQSPLPGYQLTRCLRGQKSGSRQFSVDR